MSEREQESAARLEPCPFCGNAPYTRRDEEDWVVIECRNPRCPVSCDCNEPDISDAVAAWNMRVALRSRSHNVCSVCGGEGVPLSGGKCICDGAGTEDGEMLGLRKECFALREEVAALRSGAGWTKAANDVLVERAQQESREGWTPLHDDEHGDGSLAGAAAAYALARRRELVKAGALILAEIERIDRSAPISQPPGEERG